MNEVVAEIREYEELDYTKSDLASDWMGSDRSHDEPTAPVVQPLSCLSGLC